MVYYCAECDAFMDEIEALTFYPEVHTELEERPIEWIGELRCIYCNSDNLEETSYCEGCGELFPESWLEDGLCEECRREEESNNDAL